jgi:hypothetical protein
VRGVRFSDFVFRGFLGLLATGMGDLPCLVSNGSHLRQAHSMLIGFQIFASCFARFVSSRS